jgi:hypothetical protein
LDFILKGRGMCIVVDHEVVRADRSKPRLRHGLHQDFSIIFYASLAPKMDEKDTWNIIVASLPLTVATRQEPIRLQPPSAKVTKRDIRGFLVIVAVFDDDASFGGEVLPDTKCHMFDMEAADFELTILAVDANKRKEVRFHKSPVGGSENVVLAFRLRDDTAVDLVEVEADHVFLRDVGRWRRGLLDGFDEWKEIFIVVPFTVVASHI